MDIFEHTSPAEYIDVYRAAGLGAGGSFSLGEAFPAKNGAALRGAEGHSGIFAALGAGGASFYPGVVVSLAAGRGSGAENGYALRLASLAALGFVFELLVVEKQLFAGGEDEFRTAIAAGQYLVLKFH
jgi:hypothetical protein